MKKQYVYIGMYYHIKNKELPMDLKFGVTENLEQREYSLGRTKSPIKYMILRAWELPEKVNREKVEKMIEIIFSENKYEGCEWYDIDEETFMNKISLLFMTLTDMFTDETITFKEVDLSDEKISESKQEDVIRKRNKSTNLKIVLNGNDITKVKATEGFREFVKSILGIKGIMVTDFPDIIFTTQQPYTTPLNGTSLFLKTEVDTTRKKRYIDTIINKYGLNCQVELF